MEEYSMFKDGNLTLNKMSFLSIWAIDLIKYQSKFQNFFVVIDNLILNIYRNAKNLEKPR